jgi:hypothetical protein
MCYYVESAEAIPYLVERCYFDAEQSRLKLALDRLRGLDDQFPEDGRITYAQGLLRRKYLGQGIQARELFERRTQPGRSHYCGFGAELTHFQPSQGHAERRRRRGSDGGVWQSD